MMVKAANDRDPFLARHEVNRDCVYVCVCGRVQKWLRAMCQRNNKRSPRKDVARLKLRASRVIMPRLDGSRERISQPVAADLYDPRKGKIDWFQTVETRFVSGRMGVPGSLKGNIPPFQPPPFPYRPLQSFRIGYNGYGKYLDDYQENIITTFVLFDSSASFSFFHIDRTEKSWITYRFPMIRSQLWKSIVFPESLIKKERSSLGSETLPKMNFYQISPNNI